MTVRSPLVSADWLKENLDAPDLRVVEATWYPPFVHHFQTGLEAYTSGHIPGSVFFDIDHVCDPDSPFPHTLPPAHVFSARVRKLGLGDGNRLIVYDRNRFFASARVWWMFRLMGLSDVFVLDGGLGAWTDAGGELEDMAPVAVERHFTPRVRADLMKSTEQVEAIAKDKSIPIIDGRPHARFIGEAKEPRADLESGHIPGSVSLPGDELIDPAGLLKSEAELHALFAERGIDPIAQMVATCGSGVTAAILALAAATLGNGLVAVYDGSWTEWASDSKRPIETGVSG
ncbi:MAG: sulfurtransferase [Pseudomonadota bacterium]